MARHLKGEIFSDSETAGCVGHEGSKVTSCLELLQDKKVLMTTCVPRRQSVITGLNRAESRRGMGAVLGGDTPTCWDM